MTIAARDQHRILGHHGLQMLDRNIELQLRAGNGNVFKARVMKYVDGSFHPTVRYRRHAHTRRAVRNLIGEALAHEAGADDADTDGFILICPRLECGIDDPHGSLLLNKYVRDQTAMRPAGSPASDRTTNGTFS